MAQFPGCECVDMPTIVTSLPAETAPAPLPRDAASNYLALRGLDQEGDDAEYDGTYWSEGSSSTIAPGLEELPDLSDAREAKYTVGETSFALVGGAGADNAGAPPPLYAVSSDAAPVYLKLLDRGTVEAVSADGRTFFRRAGALWRLDLRKPLPELLHVDLPPLPEPP